MPIGSFISQPAANSLRAAYRPVKFRVAATETAGTPQPPVVYCDIYFNTVFYKTIAKSQYAVLNAGVNTHWDFDIQDAAQEYLKKYLADNGGSALVDATTLITKVQCKFRSSGINSDGFIETEDTAPLQGTGGTAPVSGTGTASNTFYILNSSLQHEDNQDIAQHLDSFRTGTWAANNYPLTHRPSKYNLTVNDSDYFPAVINSGVVIDKLVLLYRYIAQATVRETEVSLSMSALTATKVFYIPDGPKNLASLFAVEFKDIEEYSVQLRDGSDDVICESVKNNIYRCADYERIHFLNYLGGIDTMNFKIVDIQHDTKSASFEVPTKSPLVKSVHGINRIDVKSNDLYTGVNAEYPETDMDWIDELLDSPAAWMEWTGTQGQSDDYIPIVITDKKTQKRKEDDRYVYEVTLEFKLSHDRNNLRN